VAHSISKVLPVPQKNSGIGKSEPIPGNHLKITHPIKIPHIFAPSSGIGLLKKPVLKILSAFLFVVFLSGIMPKEYIHEAFFDHHDDVHPLYKKGEVVITKAHNHCSFLSFEFAPFLATQQHYFTFRETVVYTGFLLPAYTCNYVAACDEHSLRGPPVFSWPPSLKSYGG
jgi:hypothetical protein